MQYKILYDNPDEDLLTRLFKIRNIDCAPEDFLDPLLQNYRINPFLLNDMEKAVQRIVYALKNNEKIMIFGDYDVDGITSSYLLYTFFKKFLNYNNVSIQYPNRLKDGYGLKHYHVDEIKQKGCDLIITVDNGITSIEEAAHAKEIGIDLIITDHHANLDVIPDALAVVNPQVSPRYPFKGICGAGVAFKLMTALLDKSQLNNNKKKKIFNYFLPIVAIATVADCVPLVNENRVIVKKGLEMINNRRQEIPKSLQGFLDYLNIKGPIDTFHIGFVIGPRINAGGRIMTPYDSLKTLLHDGPNQLEHLASIDDINTERKKLQEKAIKTAESMLDTDKYFLHAAHPDFHEGIVGIVSGRMTEKYNKPSMILSINEEENKATGSLRGPAYFSVIEMLKTADDLLERYGGHQQAGGLTVSLNDIDALYERFESYCQNHIDEKDLIKTINVDTKLYEHERNHDLLGSIEKLAPFGEGNNEPLLFLENIHINDVEKVGKNGKGHLKIHGTFHEQKIHTMVWGKGEEIDQYEKGTTKNIIGKVRTDTYNGGFFVDGSHIL